MANIFISVNNLKHTFTSKVETLTVLRGVSFQIEKGEIVCLLGRSGSGKTTTLNLLAGLNKPTGGEIIVNGENITQWSTEKLHTFRLKTTGVIFQEFHLLEHLTAIENVMTPMILANEKEEVAKERALELLKAVGLGDKTMNYPDELSTGQKQRISVARAIANNPSLIIADEPTGTLDSKTGDGIMKLLLRLIKKYDMTMFYTTHDPYITKLANRILILQQGKVFEEKEVDPTNFDYDNFEQLYQPKGGKA